MTLLLKRRKAMGASLREIAEITKVPFSLLNKVEGRLKPCPLKHAFSLTEYYNALIEDLFDSRGYAIRLADIKRDDLQLRLEAV